MQKLLAPALFAVLLSGCVHVKMDPVKIDATVTVKLQRELDDYFGAIDAASKTTAAPEEPAKAKPSSTAP